MCRRAGYGVCTYNFDGASTGRRFSRLGVTHYVVRISLNLGRFGQDGLKATKDAGDGEDPSSEPRSRPYINGGLGG